MKTPDYASVVNLEPCGTAFYDGYSLYMTSGGLKTEHCGHWLTTSHVVSSYLYDQLVWRGRRASGTTMVTYWWSVVIGQPTSPPDVDVRRPCTLPLPRQPRNITRFVVNECQSSNETRRSPVLEGKLLDPLFRQPPIRATVAIAHVSGHYAIQGHSRIEIIDVGSLASIESLYTTISE